MKRGQVLEGTVKKYYILWRIHRPWWCRWTCSITDLSWGRVNHPEEIVQLDQKLNVVILDFDDDKKRIALGLKQLTSHPMGFCRPDMNIGDKVKERLLLWLTYGAFVEIAPGVEGLIHGI